jgi:hypothetical protein
MTAGAKVFQFRIGEGVQSGDPMEWTGWPEPFFRYPVVLPEFDDPDGLTALPTTTELRGYDPQGVFFWGGYNDANVGTRFFGASDGTNHWCTSQLRSAGGTSMAGIAEKTGFINSNTHCIVVLRKSGTSIVVAAKASITLTTSGIDIVWDQVDAEVTGVIVNAIVFFGDQWTVQAGVTGSQVYTDPTLPGYYTTTTGFQPDLVMFGHTKAVSAVNMVGPFDAAIRKDLGIYHIMSMGWATFPEPAHNPPTTNVGAVGTTNTTTWGQRAYADTDYHFGNSILRTISLAENAATADFTGLHVKQLATGFGTIHTTVVGLTGVTNFGYLAVKWTSGRIVAGDVKPTLSSTGEAFSKWGGGWLGGVELDPSLRGQPSLVFMTPNALFSKTTTDPWELGNAGNNSISFAAFDADTIAGLACGGGPGTGSTPTTEAIKEISTPFNGYIPVLDKRGASAMVIFPQTFDVDGITVSYTVPPISDYLHWPYLAFVNDTGFPQYGAYLAATEASDTATISVLEAQFIDLAALEASDTCTIHGWRWRCKRPCRRSRRMTRSSPPTAAMGSHSKTSSNGSTCRTRRRPSTSRGTSIYQFL